MVKYLQSEYPEIAKEFDTIKNNISPAIVTVSSKKNIGGNVKTATFGNKMSKLECLQNMDVNNAVH